MCKVLTMATKWDHSPWSVRLSGVGRSLKSLWSRVPEELDDIHRSVAQVEFWRHHGIEKMFNEAVYTDDPSQYSKLDSTRAGTTH